MMSGFDETFDFVVVGSGGGSMCAALVVRSAASPCWSWKRPRLIGGTTASRAG